MTATAESRIVSAPAENRIPLAAAENRLPDAAAKNRTAAAAANEWGVAHKAAQKEGTMSASPDEALWTGVDDAVVRALTSADGETLAPQLRVVRGQPDEVELAALVAGIAAHQADADPEPDGHRGRWADHGHRLGLPPRPGGDAWRWSGRG